MEKEFKVKVFITSIRKSFHTSLSLLKKKKKKTKYNHLIPFLDHLIERQNFKFVTLIFGEFDTCMLLPL